MIGIEKLAEWSDVAASEAIAEVRANPPRAEGLVDLFVRALRAIDQSSSISETTKRRRIALLSGAIQLDEGGVREVAKQLNDLSREIRLAFAGELTPRLRRLLYAKAAVSPPASPVPQQDVPLQSVSALTQISQSANANENEEYTVALFARAAVDSTVNILKQNQYSTMRISSLAEWEQWIDAPARVCAFIIDGSFWQRQEPDEQRAVLKAVAEYSNLSWIMVASDSLKMTEVEAANIVRQSSPSPLGLDRLCLHAGGLQQSHIVWIQFARDRLAPKRQFQILPGELNDEESEVLQIALREAARDAGSGGAPINVDHVQATFFSGGRTSAKVAHVRFGNLEPLVAKVQAKAYARDEISRFQRFIRPFDNQLHPNFFFHRSTGVILFDLVRDRLSAPSDRPSPTLESCLHKLWLADLYHSHDPEEILTRLKQSLLDAIRKAERLNQQVLSSQPLFENYSAARLDTVLELENRGRKWGMSSKALLQRSHAKERLGILEGRATVHGDLHIRNVLIRDTNEACFIDYACSGPGHPCADFVRLELSLFFAAFKGVGDSVILTELQRDVAVLGCDEPTVIKKYPDLMAFPSNRLWLSCAIGARTAALRCLRDHYDGEIKDYLANRCIQAWVSLTLPDHSMLLARSVIEGSSF